MRQVHDESERVEEAFQRVRERFTALSQAVELLSQAVERQAARSEIEQRSHEEMRGARPRRNGRPTWGQIRGVLVAEAWFPEFSARLPAADE